MNQAKTATQTAKKVADRTITIVTTRGAKTKIHYNGENWGELKTQLQRGGSDISGNSFSGWDMSMMKAVEGDNSHTLEHQDAKLPAGDFFLFLMPMKSKSGASKKKTPAKKTATKKVAAKRAVAKKVTKPIKIKGVAKAKAKAVAEVVTSVAKVVEKKVAFDEDKFINDRLTSLKRGLPNLAN